VTSGVRLEQAEPGIQRITIDRPRRRNACDPDAWRALGDAIGRRRKPPARAH
jgi:enoyl-CoA hydratase/carnithine racemase